MGSLLIRGGRLVTMNPGREVFDGSLYIENGVIMEVGSGRTRADEVINAQDMLVIPGMIQVHVHLCQTLMRGMADDLALLDWLEKRIWPLEAAHDPDSLYSSSLLGCAELLLAGTTAILDMGTVNHQEAVFEAAARAGIRIVSGKCMMDMAERAPAALLDSTEGSVRDTVRLIEKWHGRENGRIRYALAPRFVLSCTRKLLEAVRELANSYGVLIHTHAAENRAETQLVREMTGRGNVEYLGEIGLCGSRTVLAHCIWLSAREVDLLGATGTRVAHCPSANLKLASGIADIVRLLEAGIPVGIGCDGPPCNNYLDIFNEMRLAALLQKPVHGPTAMPAGTVFEMATTRGAAILGMESEIGSLEPGKKADIVVVNPVRPHSRPRMEGNTYADLVYQVKASDVRYTIVDGRVLVREGKLAILDEEDLTRQADREARRLVARARLT